MSEKLLQIHIPNGNPNGLKRIDVPGWSGVAYVVPRQDVKKLKLENNNDKPGLYLLFGVDETTGSKLAYIGESENFYKRLTGHSKGKKDFWDTAIAFTGGLNKAYVKFLEHLATKLAKEAARMEIDNVMQPPENSLSNFDRVVVSQYFEQMIFILSSLGFEIFEPINESIAEPEIYYLKGSNFNASAKLLTNGNMTVLSDSTAGVKESNSFKGWARSARAQFLGDGTFTQENEHSYRFTKDIVFRSPSAAAATIAARSINGWTAWKDMNGNTLDQNVRK